MRREVEAHALPLGRKVYAVVNDDHFSIDAALQNEWAAMGRETADEARARLRER